MSPVQDSRYEDRTAYMCGAEKYLPAYMRPSQQNTKKRPRLTKLILAGTQIFLLNDRTAFVIE